MRPCIVPGVPRPSEHLNLAPFEHLDHPFPRRRQCCCLIHLYRMRRFHGGPDRKSGDADEDVCRRIPEGHNFENRLQRARSASVDP